MAQSGGAKIAQIFRVADTGSAYAIRQIDGTTAATAHGQATLTLDETVKTTVNMLGRLVDVEFDQDKDDEAFQNALNAVAVPAEGAAGGITVGERIYQDGEKKFGDSGNSDTSEKVLIVIYGAISGGKRKVIAAIGSITEDSGSYGMEATATSKPTFKFKGIKAKYALDAKPVLKSGTGQYIAVPTTFTIAAGMGFERQFVAIPA